MSGKLQGLKAHWTAIALGALAGGTFGWLVAPEFFWALMLGGTLTAGAVWVGYTLLATGDQRSGGSR